LVINWAIGQRGVILSLRKALAWRSAMSMRPDYDFQLSKFVRLRGWGWSLVVVMTSNLASPLTAAVGAAILHLYSALKTVP